MENLKQNRANYNEDQIEKDQYLFMQNLCRYEIDNKYLVYASEMVTLPFFPKHNHLHSLGMFDDYFCALFVNLKCF